jgi:hypothetical protein
MGVNSDVNLCLRRSDLLGGPNLDDVRHGQKLVLMTDVNLCLRRSDLLGGPNLDASRVNRSCALRDRSLGAMMDVNLCRRMNVTDDRRDLNLVVKMDAMSHHVKLMVYLNTSCDRMSHDHLQCGHLMMHHRDTNRMDGMNLVGKMKNSDAKNSDAKNSDAKNSDARMI